jgi:D-beta-D-heptose 7-phosphate kinase / D-beta-D-heptose 1-phosphate adenosyltransferase
LKERFIGRAAGRHPHQILRVDQETCEPLPEPIARELFNHIGERCGEVSALLISDYAKGVCTPHLLSESIAAAGRVGCTCLIDPARITDYGRYSGCDVLIPNRAEAESVIGSKISSDAEAISAAKQLQVLYRVRAVIVKLDRDGMVLVDGENSGDVYPTRAREVVDVTGAGDIVLAIVGLCRAAGVSLSDAVRLANLAAGLEVERIGVAPVTRGEILAECLHEQPAAHDKLVTLDEMEILAESYRRAGRQIVLTNGCFDLLHVGHVTCLQEAAQYGDVLVVAINSDASVRKIKGSQRPISGEVDRARLLSALACVSHVLIFDDDTPLDLLRRIRPDVLAKGGTTAQVVGAEIVEAYGGRVVRTVEVPDVSTTRIASRLTQQHTFAIPVLGASLG